MVKLGAHMSVAGGVSQGLDRAKQINIEAVQIFTRNNNRWFASPIAPEELNRFKNKAARFERANLISHAAYLINIASPDEELHQRSLDALYDEMFRAQALGLAWVVLHPGNHMGMGEEWGMKRVIRSLDHVLERTKGFSTGILLENTSGQGTSLGYDFTHLAKIRRRVKHAKRVGVCMDTCHMFAAGYDVRDLKSYHTTMETLDRTVGLNHVKAVHLNDSLKPFESRLDRHAHIGQGEIGLDGFAFFMNDERMSDLPMVLETPKGPDMKEDVENINRLKGLIGTVTV